MNKPTPGPWKYIGAEFCKRKRGLIIADNETGDCVAILQQPMPWSSELECYEANAALIVEAANACLAINPSNPQAVAETLPDLVISIQLLIRQMGLKNIFNEGASAGWIHHHTKKLRDALAKLEAK